MYIDTLTGVTYKDLCGCHLTFILRSVKSGQRDKDDVLWCTVCVRDQVKTWLKILNTFVRDEVQFRGSRFNLVKIEIQCRVLQDLPSLQLIKTGLHRSMLPCRSGPPVDGPKVPGPMSCRCPSGLLETPSHWHATICSQNIFWWFWHHPRIHCFGIKANHIHTHITIHVGPGSLLPSKATQGLVSIC